MNKVLLISYYFPPYQGVGGMRSAGFYKYLPEFGWEPYVVTAIYYDKTSELDKNIFRFPVREQKEISFGLVKDPGVTWLKALKKRLPPILKQHDFDVIYISGGPFLHFGIGPWIKRKYGIPFVLDFRDPFANNPRFPKRPVRDFVARKLEKQWISHSSAVIVVNKYNIGLLEKESKTPVVIIENGYDDDIIAKVKQKTSVNSRKDYYTIVYAGKFMPARDPLMFIQALSVLIRQNVNLRFVHIGSQYDPLKQYIKQYKIEDFVDILGPRSYEDTLSVICNADCGLLISDQHPFESTTKVYDYVGCYKPIFAIGIAEQGGIANVLKRYGLYITAENAVSDIVKKLRLLLNKPITIKEPINISCFGRRASARHLAQVLYAVKEKRVGELL